jgi:transposase-like protein
MARYSEERRAAVVAKLLPPQNLSPQAVAEQEGLSLATVYKWRQEARAKGCCLPDADARGASAWSSQDRFGAVVETVALNAEETAEYCRRRGLYPEQLAAWRADCEQAGNLAEQARRSEAGELKRQRGRIRALESELQRKNAALAEMAALLTLSKKAQAIWGDVAA